MTSLGPVSVDEVIRAAAGTYGSREFLVLSDGERLSFEEYDDATARAASVWLERGVKRGDLVVVALHNGLDLLLAWHGLNRIGAVMVPLNMHFQSREAAYVVDHSRPRAVITTAEHRRAVVAPAMEAAGVEAEVIDVVDFSNELATAAPFAADVALAADDPAAVLYTSGTTGPPKGCITTQAHYSVNGQLLADELRLTSTSTKLVMLPLFHMNAENSTMAALTVGARVLLRDGFSASAFWKDVREHDVTHTHYLGSILPVLDKGADPLEVDNSLEVMWGAGCSGDALRRLEQRWGLRIIEVFGMTETGMDLCNPYDGPRVPGSCGRVVAGKEVRLVDTNGQQVAVGQVGELIIRRTTGMTTGYLRDPQATERLYRDGWLYTGDLARQDDEGYFYFVDRAKDIIRRSGENISSAEVESVLREHPSVVHAACIPRPDPFRDEEVHAVVTLVDGTSPGDCTPAELGTWCAERLATYKVPRYIEYLEELPQTPTGKIQKATLRDPGRRSDVFDREKDWARVPSGPT